MRWLALASLLTLALSGCFGASPGATDQTGAVAATGLLRGVVVDEAIRPLSGAAVGLQLPDGSARNTTSGDDGTWRVTDLPAGAYLVTVTLAGFLDHRTTANVTAGLLDPPAVRAVLAVDQRQLASIAAFAFEGFLQCSFTAIALRQACDVDEAVRPACTTAGVCPGNVTEDRFMAVHNVAGEGLAYIQSEITWDASTQLGQSLGAVPAARDPATGTLQSYAGVEGSSPLIVPLPGDVANAFGLGAGGTEYALRIFGGYVEGTAPPCLPSPAGCQWGVGIALQQSFTVVTHVFYGFAPPEGWQFGRDGLPALPA